MIGIYVEGSKSLGLGHLSRISVIYYCLSQYYDLRVYFHGDIVGKAYLENFGIKSFDLEQDEAIIPKHTFWIIDSTTISSKEIENCLVKAELVVLLSPNFDDKHLKYIDLTLLRSDPYNLNLNNKIIDKRFVVQNRLSNLNSGVNLGIILSGADFTATLMETVEFCLNDNEISGELSSITVILGSTNAINFERKELSSYKIGLNFVSVFGNPWEYLKDTDLVIVGNGIVVEEAIAEGKKCIVYMHSKNNSLLKLNESLAQKVVIAKNKTELKKNIIEESNNFTKEKPLPLNNKVPQNQLLKKLLKIFKESENNDIP